MLPPWIGPGGEDREHSGSFVPIGGTGAARQRSLAVRPNRPIARHAPDQNCSEAREEDLHGPTDEQFPRSRLSFPVPQRWWRLEA